MKIKGWLERIGERRYRLYGPRARGVPGTKSPPGLIVPPPTPPSPGALLRGVRSFCGVPPGTGPSGLLQLFCAVGFKPTQFPCSIRLLHLWSSSASSRQVFFLSMAGNRSSSAAGSFPFGADPQIRKMFHWIPCGGGSLREGVTPSRTRELSINPSFFSSSTTDVVLKTTLHHSEYHLKRKRKLANISPWILANLTFVYIHLSMYHDESIVLLYRPLNKQKRTDREEKKP